MTSPSKPRRLVLTLVLALGLFGLGCRNTPAGGSDPGAPLPAPADELPPLVLRDTTPNLLLTWVDAEGDFHVVEKTGDVPADRRAQVRVVVTDQPQGTGQTVYVADLTSQRADGTYGVSTLPRSEWEKIGADRRKARLEALAPGERPTGPESDSEGAKETAETNGKLSAIVYGADWCKPCHDAQRYLEQLGVSVTKKNIEESRSAQAEMQQKLARVNRRGASIPVIDVMGKILVGFSPGSLKQAVEAARSAAGHRRG
jgi:glutaredoxin